MKVLLINGSPNADGNTAAALKVVSTALNAEGVETDTVCIGTKPVQGCIGCRKCKTTGVCVFKDELYLTLREKASEADGIIIGDLAKKGYRDMPRHSDSAFRWASALCSTVCFTLHSLCCSTNPRHRLPWPVAQGRWQRSTVSTNISA